MARSGCAAVEKGEAMICRRMETERQHGARRPFEEDRGEGEVSTTTTTAESVEPQGQMG